MKHQIVAVQDTAVNSFMRPFTVRTEQEALRAFGHAVNQPGDPMNTSPADYLLFHLGTFDDETGELQPETVRLIARAKDLIKPQGE